MAMHLYLDAALTSPISEGDGANPDSDIFNGTTGESKDKQIYLANEQTTLSAAVDLNDTVIHLNAPRFSNGESIIIGSEQMTVSSGGGTTTLTVDRSSSDPIQHENGTPVYSAYNYTEININVTDTSGTNESQWVQFARDQEMLDQGDPVNTLPLGSKAYNQVLTFWRRINVPTNTPVQLKTDLKYAVSGFENPMG